MAQCCKYDTSKLFLWAYAKYYSYLTPWVRDILEEDINAEAESDPHNNILHSFTGINENCLSENSKLLRNTVYHNPYISSNSTFPGICDLIINSLYI